jgi:glycopeptide antibiotics resistance protein
MNSIEKYVDKISNELAYSKTERNEFRLQFIDHINSLKDEYLEKGFSEEESVKSAIKDFGNSDLIKAEINNKVPEKYTIIDTFFCIVFIIYCIFLMLVLLNTARSGSWVNGARSGGLWLVKLNSIQFATVNIIPFRTILYYLTIGNKCDTSIIIHNLLGKVILFIPWGILLPLTFKKIRTYKDVTIVTAIVVLLIQIIRTIFPIGVADIDNVILYTLGSIAGFALYKFIIKIIKSIKPKS